MKPIMDGTLVVPAWQHACLHAYLVIMLLSAVPMALFGQRSEDDEHRRAPRDVPSLVLRFALWMWPVWLVAGAATTFATAPIGVAFGIVLAAATS